MAAQGEPPATTEIKCSEAVNVNCLKEVPEPGPSARSNVESPSKSVVSSFWASSRSVEELRKLQREDRDIGPIVAAKLEGRRPP